MGSSYKRLLLAGATIAALMLCAAFFGASSSASVAKKSHSPSMSGRATSGSLRAVRGHQLRAPKAPMVVLYDQYDHAAASVSGSQNFEPARTSSPTTSVALVVG